MSNNTPKTHYGQDAAPTPQLIKKGASIPQLIAKPISSNNSGTSNNNSGQNQK